MYRLNEKSAFKSTLLAMNWRCPVSALSSVMTKPKTLLVSSLAFLSIVVSVILCVMMLDWHSRIDYPTQLNAADTQLAKQLISSTIPEEYAKPSEKQLTLNAKELEVILNFLLQQYHKGAITVQIYSGKIRIKLAVKLYNSELSPYLNTKLVAKQKNGRFELRTLKVGSLKIPNQLSFFFTRLLLKNSPFAEYDRLFHQHIRGIQLAENQVQIAYLWDPEAITNVASLIRDQADQERVAIYLETLQTYLQQQDENEIPLYLMLQKLFSLASERSDDGDQAVQENRAVLVALSRHLHKRRLVLAQQKKVSGTALTLNKRRDLAYHFVSSAALSATSSEKFSDLIGLYKEIHDTDRGSGFSFTDMTANRAGSRFGELAVKNPETAIGLQKIMRKVDNNQVFMPETQQLPEGLKPNDFNDRYGNLQNPAYEQLKAAIEESIAARPIFNNHN